MKASGIIRRIDDLGRIVIPKEIRRAMGAREGTPMEIFHDKEGTILLKKYLPEQDLLGQVISLDEAVKDMAVELGPETTGDMRRHIKGLKMLLKEREGGRDGR